MNNPIIQEIREARAALTAEHGYDLSRINEWARQQTLARQKEKEAKTRMARKPSDQGEQQTAASSL